MWRTKTRIRPRFLRQSGYRRVIQSNFSLNLTVIRVASKLNNFALINIDLEAICKVYRLWNMQSVSNIYIFAYFIKGLRKKYKITRIQYKIQDTRNTRYEIYVSRTSSAQFATHFFYQLDIVYFMWINFITL